jgi:hypothetical protein
MGAYKGVYNIFVIYISKWQKYFACVVTNNSDVTVWPYVLEFAEDGSVHQRYPYYGGKEELGSGKSTKEVAQMARATTLSSLAIYSMGVVEYLISTILRC